MKLLFLLICLFLIPHAIAQDQVPQEEVDLLLLNYKNRLEVLKIQDNLLKTLLKIPFEKRVYIYPALFESNIIPKKIVTHPQILMWKGKKPTRIAPQMQEFAKKHLDYMPARFYPFLDPDGWPKQNKEDDWHNVTELLPNVLVTPNETIQNELINETK